jgi:predicted neutral ceramidase superfamily lipid hydrolase
MFAAFPLLALPVLLYNLIALTLAGGFKSVEANGQLIKPLFWIPMTSRAQWPVSLGDLILAVALVVLFIELLKSTTSRRVAIINHSLSMILFIVCLVEFLLAPAFATSTFFLLTLMVLLDVLAGFIVTIVAARRDIDLTSGGV